MLTTHISGAASERRPFHLINHYALATPRQWGGSKRYRIRECLRKGIET
jgi:hypothetical protein